MDDVNDTSRQCCVCGSKTNMTIFIDGDPFCYECSVRYFNHCPPSTNTRSGVTNKRVPRKKPRKQFSSHLDSLIFKAYYDEKMKPSEIAKLFHVDSKHVYSVISGE